MVRIAVRERAAPGAGRSLTEAVRTRGAQSCTGALAHSTPRQRGGA